MKKYKNLSILGVGVLFLLGIITACGSDDGPSPEVEVPKEEVLFDVSVNGVEITRTDRDGTKFENGDIFKLYFNSFKPTEVEKTDSVRFYKLNGTKWEAVKWDDTDWIAETPIYWDDQGVKARDITAITRTENYTVSSSETDPDLFTVQTDQSRLDNYLASDLLIARVRTDKRLIKLPFYHMMSRIRVNIVAPTKGTDPDGKFTMGDFEDDLNVCLPEMALEADINYGVPTDKAHGITTQTKASSKSDNIKMYTLNAPKLENDSIRASYLAIIPPKASVGAYDDIFSMKLQNGKTYWFTPGVITTFSEQGKQTTINLVLKKRDVMQASLATDITIEPWGELKVEDDDPIQLK